MLEVGHRYAPPFACKKSTFGVFLAALHSAGVAERSRPKARFQDDEEAEERSDTLRLFAKAKRFVGSRAPFHTKAIDLP